MKQLYLLTKRNTSLFFKDKGLFFTALITPMILLVLYATFLGNVYRDVIVSIVDGINSALPDTAQIEISERLLNGYVGGQLVSSILAVSCVTVSVCCNMLMVQDKVTGAHKDLMISPVSPSRLAISYYVSTLFSTLLICLAAFGVSLIYLAIIGFYLTVADVFFIILDILMLVMFGTALSSVINFFLSTQGQISAVGSIISSCYGFICGAYMPISQFGDGLANVVGLLPGTYGTSLLRQHTLGSVIDKMGDEGLADYVDGIKDTVDCNIYVFGDTQVPTWVMYTVLLGTIAILVGAYVLMNILRDRKMRARHKPTNTTAETAIH